MLVGSIRGLPVHFIVDPGTWANSQNNIKKILKENMLLEVPNNWNHIFPTFYFEYLRLYHKWLRWLEDLFDLYWTKKISED